MNSSLLFETGETMSLERADHIIEAYYHWCNLLLEFTEMQFWNMLVDLAPPHFLVFLDFDCNILLENHLTRLWREVLNSLGKSAAFFPASHQPCALVCCSRHRGSGGITVGSFVSNCALPSLPPLSSIYIYLVPVYFIFFVHNNLYNHCSYFYFLQFSSLY